MYSVLREMMVNSTFLPTRWKRDEVGRMPKEGDIVLMSRQKNKVSEILEYGLVTKVLDGGRTLEMRVCREGGTAVKCVTGSSRLAHLVLRPKRNTAKAAVIQQQQQDYSRQQQRRLSP